LLFIQSPIFGPLMKKLNLLGVFTFLGATLFCLISGCGPSTSGQEDELRAGAWILEFDLSASEPGLRVPVSMIVDEEGRISIHNNGEVIPVDSLSWEGPELTMKMPYFQVFLTGKALNDTLIHGALIDPARSAGYTIPFEGKYAGQEKKERGKLIKREIYEATFSPGDTLTGHKAIGIFDICEQGVTGTFLTETGDYRFLNGEITEGKLRLSSFDGARLFYFTGEIKGDSITSGKFFSGIHWSEPWFAWKNEQASLRDPDSLTYLLPGTGPFAFSAKKLTGEEVHFDREFFKKGVTIVQIFGSWCPNCSDESLYLKSLHNRLAIRGLQVIPVAFERADTDEENAHIIESHARDLGLHYPVYLGGGKKNARNVFPMLNRILSFPTTLIIDRRGEVRKIHTGFYGPGTGEYYGHYTERLELLVTQLLDE